MSRRRNPRRGQEGNTIVAVTAIGTACTLILAAVMNNSVVVEDRAIDAELAEMRAYWGAMGHFRYALSRVRFDYACDDGGGCGPTDNGFDTEKAAVVQSYLDEIEDLRVLGGPAMLDYPEEGQNYFIALDVAAAPDDTPGRHNFSGHLMMTAAPASGQSGVPALADLAPRMSPYEMRFCVGLASPASKCGAIGSDNGGNFTANLSVKRLTRLASN